MVRSAGAMRATQLRQTLPGVIPNGSFSPEGSLRGSEVPEKGPGGAQRFGISGARRTLAACGGRGMTGVAFDVVLPCDSLDRS